MKFRVRGCTVECYVPLNQLNVLVNPYTEPDEEFGETIRELWSKAQLTQTLQYFGGGGLLDLWIRVCKECGKMEKGHYFISMHSFGSGIIWSRVNTVREYKRLLESHVKEETDYKIRNRSLLLERGKALKELVK